MISPAARSGGRAVNVDELIEGLDVAAARLDLPPSSGPIPLSTPPTLAIGADKGERAGIEVHLRVNGREAIDKAFELEGLIAERLESDAAGYVDGNEVGNSDFTIYAYGPDMVLLRASVEAVVRDRWAQPGVVLRVLDNEEEVETVALDF